MEVLFMPTGSGGILSWVLIIGVFYVFLIMPERKKQKNMKSMINSVKAGDKIITRGGIYGTIFSLDEDKMVIVTGPEETKLEISKLSISSVIESKQDLEDEENAEEKIEEIAGNTEVAEETTESVETVEKSE
jgi:preprotein translocase subunit YajC